MQQYKLLRWCSVFIALAAFGAFANVAPMFVAPTLVAPANDSMNTPTSLTLTWDSVVSSAGSVSYTVQVSTASDLSNPISTQTEITGTQPTVSTTVSGLAHATQYYWGVTATDADMNMTSSTVDSFTTVVAKPASPPGLALPMNDTMNAPTSLTLSWYTVTNAATMRFRCRQRAISAPRLMGRQALRAPALPLR